jgi:hypothetical protein
MLDLAGNHDPKTGWLIRITEMLIRILILLFIKVLQIYDHWSTDPNLHASIVSVRGLPWLQFEPLLLHSFDFNADPDPAFHSNAGWSNNNAYIDNNNVYFPLSRQA